MRLATMTRTMLALNLLLLLLLGVEAAYYEEDPRATQCRQSIIDMKSVPGPGTAYAFPSECGIVLPFANLYNGREVLLGEFIASSCGECASACVAHRSGREFSIGTSDPSQQGSLDAIMAARNGESPCTDWVWCDPWEVSYPGDNCDGVTNETDPFTGKCVGRWRDGNLEPFAGYGMDLLLEGSTRGCQLKSGKTIPAGTCALKSIDSDKWKDHVWNASEDPKTAPLMSGLCDWTLA
ncbi:hypothetical protein HOP50_16g78280 [Chloropicon primus]|uniref:Expansin-like EG45 domain-containing protein n=1 Tax=Chloropicon primus TaxID=1764295 RepID=A0A5B8N0H1_9CHLO|nr:hypothetical protein A3770_16p77980 [Chloropicon primus]UPR04486.1 hypothetical protein HOP50_16g78280 [Chloropicon primus]|mmetsp:Transcript_5094/g.15299  ORF Transcript_5094/g.15299 Transcript_5094/m.15299 type:complete len:237 (-) Transcript_5094:130-840(-)|eukprot:QDZ25280.1 hypothetical protein A3770_16p77980 [Chloropicon primus]